MKADWMRDQSDPNPLPESLPLEIRVAQETRLKEVWKSPPSWRYWSAVNNSDVGIWYTTVAMIFFLFGGVLALIMRIQLAIPNNTFLTADQYNQTFTMHGTVMMFLFAVPILEAFSILLLPQMLGARDLPFPRLSAYGFWCFLIGGLFVCGSIFFDAAPKGGWFMYPPLTTAHQKGIGADVWLLGLTFIEISSIAAAIELIVGTLKCRPPGMRINLIPLYAWYILVVGAMILFAFPPLIAGDVLLEMERAFNWPFFDPARGGDPLLWQHLFWIFGHPEVYIIFLPSVALMAMIVPTFARTPIVGYSWIVLSAIGTGFISFGLWVHHMFTTGLPGVSLGIFSAASQAVAIPTGVQLFCLLATLLVGRIQKSVCLLWIFGGLSTFVIGGLTGVMIAVVTFDFQAHDTYFIVGHLHYVLIGGTIFPIVAGIFYYYPMVTGKKLSGRMGILSFWLSFVGFNLAFFPMHLTGLLGMPRRVYTFPSGLGIETTNLLSTIGAFILGAGMLVLSIELIRPRRRQPYCERNPWGAGTCEWLIELPPESWGVRSVPEIDSRYPLWQQSNLLRDVDEGRFYLPDAQEGQRETLVTSVIDAVPMQCLRVGGSTWTPMLAAVFSGGFFIISTYKMWTPAIISGVLAIGTILYWLWTGTAVIPEKEKKEIGLGVTVPLYVSGPSAVGWWGMFITMTANMTAFVSLIFSYFFFWTVHEDFPPQDHPHPSMTWLVIGFFLLFVAFLLTNLSRRFNSKNQSTLFYLSLGTAILLSAASGFAMWMGPASASMNPESHVYPAIVWVLVGWTVLHVGLGMVMQMYCLARRAFGKMTDHYDADIVNVSLYWSFLILTGFLAVLTVAGFPLVV